MVRALWLTACELVASRSVQQIPLFTFFHLLQCLQMLWHKSPKKTTCNNNNNDNNDNIDVSHRTSVSVHGVCSFIKVVTANSVRLYTIRVAGIGYNQLSVICLTINRCSYWTKADIECTNSALYNTLINYYSWDKTTLIWKVSILRFYWTV